jgi:hypothetical protein
MIYLNKLGPGFKPIPFEDKTDNERVGKVMTKEELHKFGMDLLITYLHKQNCKFFGVNDSIGFEYPHLIVKNGENELLYIWIRIEMFPTQPNLGPIANKEAAIKLSKQFNAKPLFAGIRMKCTSSEDSSIPIIGGEYIAEFSGLNKIRLEELDPNMFNTTFHE